MMNDRSSTPRKRSLQSGKIMLKGGVIDCLLRNRSFKGARLQVGNACHIPDRFTLVIDPAGQRRSVRVEWRNQSEIGVVFEDKPRT